MNFQMFKLDLEKAEEPDIKNPLDHEKSNRAPEKHLLFLYWLHQSLLLVWITTNCGKFFSSVQLLSHVWLFATPWTAAPQASQPSPTLRAYSKSRPLSQTCHPAISLSVVPFSSCLQSLPASGSFPMSQFFVDCIELLHLWLQRILSIWFWYWSSGDVHM